MNIKPGDKVTVVRDITRSEGPYAKAGDTGEVTEVFLRDAFKSDKKNRTWYAKVLTEQQVKTFRITSLKKQEQL